MTDLVQRLRDRAAQCWPSDVGLPEEAADRIEELTADHNAYRECAEALARENEKLKGVIHFQNHGSLNTITEDETADFIDKQRQTIEAQQQRIKELEANKINSDEWWKEKTKRLDAALAEIEKADTYDPWDLQEIARKARQGE